MDYSMTERNDLVLKSIAVELEEFEELCSEEFHATAADWDFGLDDWIPLFCGYMSIVVGRVDTLTPEQREKLADLIRRARVHKDEILAHDYVYPKIIDMDFPWMVEHEHDTPEQKAFLNNNFMLQSMTIVLEEVEVRCSGVYRATPVDWEFRIIDWTPLVYERMGPMLERADTLTPEQREKLVNIIKRTRVLKEVLLAHHYPYPQEIDSQRYAWMPSPIPDTPEEKVNRQIDLELVSMTVAFERVEELCSRKYPASQGTWNYRRVAWTPLFYTRMGPMLEKAAALTAEQREKLVDIIRRTRAIKEQLLAHNYPYPEEVDRDYAWMRP